MLLRTDGEGAWAITQTTHSWLAGELAVAWGGGDFEMPGGADELIRAAGLHDFGYVEWEQAPVRNPETGFPYDYLTLPHDEHLAIWRRGIAGAQTVSRTAALLISLHSLRLYRLHYDEADHSAQENATLETYRGEQKAFQDELLASLGEGWDRDRAERLARLVGAWDMLSHLICEAHASFTVDDIPTRRGDLSIEGRLESPQRLCLSPWPFLGEELTVSFEARWLPHPAKDQDELDQLLAVAPTRSFTVCLLPGTSSL